MVAKFIFCSWSVMCPLLSVVCSSWFSPMLTVTVRQCSLVSWLSLLLKSLQLATFSSLLVRRFLLLKSMQSTSTS